MRNDRNVIPYNSNCSQRHILIDCIVVADIRQSLYSVNAMSDLSTNVAGDTILIFFKEINLYAKI